MKKLLILIIFLFMPVFVYAERVEDVNYEVDAVYISGDVDIAGSMHVKEAIIIKGSLNGFERVINYKNPRLSSWYSGSDIDFFNSAIYNAKGISLKKASSFKIDKSKIDNSILSISPSEYNESSYATPGDSGKYSSSKTSDGLKIRIYNPNTYGYVVYYLEYYINQVVVLHNDVAELYWQFIPTDFDYIDEVHIEVNLPGSSTDDKFRVWAHGPLTGNVEGIVDRTDSEGNTLYKGVVADATYIDEGDGVDIRVTFDPSFISIGEELLNKSGVDALDKIIAVEEMRAEEANEIRERVKTRNSILGYLSIVYVFGIIVIWIYIYNKYDKEYKVTFDAKYYREFTGDYDVEVVDYLMNKSISTNAMSASIMNLIYKKNIEVIENSDDKKNPTLQLLSRDNLSQSEKILVDLLFNQVGKNGQMTMKNLERYTKKYSTAEKFIKKYDSWKDSVEKAANREEFFEDYTGKKVLAGLYVIVGIILFIVSIYYDAMPFFIALIMVVSSISFLIYICSFKKWTMKGREHYLKWKAFKNFLKDFGSFKDKELPEVKLWEKYLVYATLFGLAKEVQKTMRIKLTEMGYDATYVHSYWYYNDFYMGNVISNSISKAHSSSNAAIAASSSSSGGGFGGGFSSGGGFGGGGGSGHGF